MSKELFWLTLTVAMTGLFWVPYVLDRIFVRGLFAAMANPSAGDKPQSAWAQRMMRAHDNAVENLVIFSSLILTTHVLGISTTVTATAAAIYFWARLSHYLIYSFGIPILRTLSFTVGFGAQAALVLAIFKLL